MWMRLRKNLNILATTYSSKKTSFAVKFNSKLKLSLYWKIRTFIKDLPFKSKLGCVKFVKDFEVRIKVLWALGKIVDIVVTGLIVSYSIHNRNFLSYGLVLAMSTYYIKWFIREAKRPFE